MGKKTPVALRFGRAVGERWGRCRRELCVVCSAPAATSSTSPELLHRQKHPPNQISCLLTVFRRLRSPSLPPAPTATASPSSTQQMNLRSTRVHKRDIIHSHAEHVEKKRRILRGNTMSCRHCSMMGSMENPPHPSPDCNPEEDISSEADSDAADHSNLPPKVFALPWHDDVSHIMHMLP